MLGPGVATMAGQTDIFYFDDLTKNVIKRIELVNVISQQIQHLSQCVDVSYKNEALYVVDKGHSFHSDFLEHSFRSGMEKSTNIMFVAVPQYKA